MKHILASLFAKRPSAGPPHPVESARALTHGTPAGLRAHGRGRWPASPEPAQPQVPVTPTALGTSGNRPTGLGLSRTNVAWRETDRAPDTWCWNSRQQEHNTAHTMGNTFVRSPSAQPHAHCVLPLWSTEGNEAGDLSGQTDPRRRKWRLELGHPLVLSNIQNFRKRGPRTSSPCRLSALVWGVQYLYFLGTQRLWGCSAPCTDVWSQARTALTPLESTKVMAVAGWGG